MQIEFWRLKDKLNYIFRAKHKTGQGIHSPFLYNLIRKVFIDKMRYEDYDKVKKYRKHLISLKDEVKYIEYGAGSKRITNNQIKHIRDIAERSSIPAKYGKLLYRLARYFQPESIIELGTSLGISTYYLALACPGSKLYTIEGNKELSQYCKNELENSLVTNTEFIEGNIDNKLPELLEKLSVVDFVFIDANHTYEATMKYFNLLAKMAGSQSIFIFDDINWSIDMQKAWSEIKADIRVTQTVDIYQLGIVFFNLDLSKQDFIIKF